MEHAQITPQAGWLEHDPQELVANSVACIEGAVNSLGKRKDDIKAIGITNQRETTILWDKHTGAPLYNAIVWSDGRTGDIVESFTAKLGSKDALRQLCGLPLSTYFGAIKVRWLIDNVPDVKEAIQDGRCMFGTVDSWLLYNLTGRTVHATDVTNASRTMMMNINTCYWDKELCEILGVTGITLPEIRSNSEIFGEMANGILQGVPIAGIIGDQQAATVGQACFKIGQAKNTYGTGCFLLVNTGTTIVQSKHGLLTTPCYKIGNQATVYALEGAIANAGNTVQWLRDNLGFFKEAPEIEALAADAQDTGGVIFVPALSGLYAPYWRSDARGTILGLTQFSNKAHICRATLQGVCYMTREVLEAMVLDSGHALANLAVDGGMSRNNLMMQMQADTLGVPVVRAANPESTSMGCTVMAGLAVGIWKDTDEVASTVAGGGAGKWWEPLTTCEERDAEFSIWKKAVMKSFASCSQ
uniref:glycerol kinase n=1 Tax=Eutreptiella gymnastica TaxID=73025 RepID=A0A7S1NE19_9EUGL